MQRKRQFMDDNVWDIILHRYVIPYRHINAKTIPTVIFHKDSETLLDKKLANRFRGLPPDVKIDIYSNGVLLPAWSKRGEDFIDLLGSLPNQCRLLLSYHPNNHDWSENNYQSMIPYLKEVLQNRKPHNVEFITVSHRSRWVTEEIQNTWRQHWEGLPITVHSNCSINPWTGRIEEDGTVKFNGCPYGDFSHWFFGVTGNIIACCLDLEEEIVLGNVLEDNPEVMFYKTEQFYKDQRNALSEGKKPAYDVCMNCFGYERSNVPQELIPLGVKIV